MKKNNKTIFKEGFKYKKFKFGWKKEKLFRLPGKVHNRNYPMREIPIIQVGNQVGYRIVRDKLSLNQVIALTKIVNYSINTNCKSCLKQN